MTFGNDTIPVELPGETFVVSPGVSLPLTPAGKPDRETLRRLVVDQSPVPADGTVG
jgi:hypothetical protein